MYIHFFMKQQQQNKKKYKPNGNSCLGMLSYEMSVMGYNKFHGASRKFQHKTFDHVLHRP